MKEFYIKNMISNQCMETIKKILKDNNLQISSIEPGKLKMNQYVDGSTIERLRITFKKAGFALIDDTLPGKVNQIKSYIIKLIHYRNNGEKINMFFSRYLSRHMNEPYSVLKKMFFSIEKKTLGHYIIEQKIERAKKLLTLQALQGDVYNITDISVDLGYNSLGYLCAHFKKITGITMGDYKSVGVEGGENFDC